MKYELYAPQVLGQPAEQGISVYPSPEVVDSRSRLFVMSRNAAHPELGDLCAQAVGQYIQSHFDPNKLFTAAMLQAAFDEARKALDGNKGTSLAILCFHRGGVLMATVGSIQVLHTRLAENKILFSSLETDECVELSEKLAVTRTTDVQPGDDFLITPYSISDEQLLSLVPSDDDEHTAPSVACGVSITVESTHSEAADAMQPNDESFSRNNARLLPKKRSSDNGKSKTGLIVGLVLAGILLAVGGWYGYEFYQAKKHRAQTKPKPVEVLTDTAATDTVPPVIEDTTQTPAESTPSSSKSYYNDPVVMPYSDPGPYVDPAELEQETKQNEAAANMPDTPADDEMDEEEPEAPARTGGVPPPPPRKRNKQQPGPPPPPPSK